MAVTKPTPKSAPAKSKAKPAAKAAKPSVSSKKAISVKPAAVKKAAPTPAKKASPAPAKKAAPAPAKKAAPAPAKKAAPTPVKKAAPAPAKKAAPAPAKKAAPAPAKKAAPTPAKKAAPAPIKKATPASAEKAAPAPVKKAAPAPVKKATPAPAEKAAPKADVVAANIPVAVQKEAPVSPTKTAKEPVAVEAKAAPVEMTPVKPAAPKRSSLVDFPVPPPPVKPPFVPPKTPAAPTTSLEPVTAGTNASHSPAFIQKQRQRLLDLRDDLVDAMSGMTRDTIRNAPEGSEASGSGQHQGDAGSDAYDRDFALSVLAKEQDALYEIEQALRRIQTGNYGICEISARKIPQARLEAIPFARLTVECQAQWEKEYGKRRFRPSNEVGFSGGNYIEDEDSDTVSLDEEED